MFSFTYNRKGYLSLLIFQIYSQSRNFIKQKVPGGLYHYFVKINYSLSINAFNWNNYLKPLLLYQTKTHSLIFFLHKLICLQIQHLSYVLWGFLSARIYTYATDSSTRFLTFGIFDTLWTVICYWMLACGLYLGSTWAKTTFEMFCIRYCFLIVVVVAGAASSSSSLSSSSSSSSHLYRHLYLCFHRLSHRQRHRHRLVIVIAIVIIVVIFVVVVTVLSSSSSSYSSSSSWPSSSSSPQSHSPSSSSSRDRHREHHQHHPLSCFSIV